MSLRRFFDLCRDYATGGSRHIPCSGLSGAEAQIAWGGAATEHPRCKAPAADFARDDVKFPVHGRKDYRSA